MSKKKVSILGFGFSGLAAAWAFHRQGYEVEVYEKSERVGGLLGTSQTEYGLVETAANAILKSKAVDHMATDFGITWAERKKSIKNKWVYTDKPRRWPLTVSETVKNISPLFNLARSNEKLKPLQGESVSVWGRKHFNSPNFVDHLLGPALQGIYAQGPDTLSASLSLKSLFAKTKIRTEGSHSPVGGMSDFFIKGLETLNKSDRFSIQLASRKTIEGLDSPLVIDTQPDYQNVHYLPVTTVTLFFEDQHRPHFQGFGCLFAKSHRMLGVLFNTDIFEGRSVSGVFSETWIVAGEKIDESLLIDELLAYREDKFKVSFPPIFFKATHWERGIPSYDLKHEKFLLSHFKEEERIPQGTLLRFGNYTGEIGLNKILEKAVIFSKHHKNK